MTGTGSIKKLGKAPTIHPEARVVDCVLGAWTEVGRGTRLAEVTMGDYSYITENGDVVWATIGKFCSIADAARINPGNHPTWRAVQHHAVYRSEAYGFGPDEAAFFEWRKADWVTIGHDVRIRGSEPLLVKEDPAGRKELIEAIEVPDIARQHGPAALERLEIQAGIVQQACPLATPETR